MCLFVICRLGLLSGIRWGIGCFVLLVRIGLGGLWLMLRLLLIWFLVRLRVGGLSVVCRSDSRVYVSGRKVSDVEFKAINILKIGSHGEWNYKITPTK
jgi:hypothetical protein